MAKKDEARAQRLAEALRANLRKRKEGRKSAEAVNPLTAPPVD
jgi:hypothetical protein